MSLRCPKCHQSLHLQDRCYRCESNHTYDIAKGGYVNLVLSNRKATGDDKGMVDARTNFLEKGYYQSLQTSLCKILNTFSPRVLVDAGCGQGYYTNAFQEACEHTKVYGFDLSKFALKQACKAHTAVQYAAASVADVPLQDTCADTWVSVFAPVYIEDVNRVLEPQGIFIKVGPGEKHLFELKQELYDTVYDNESEVSQYDGFIFLERHLVEDSIDLDSQEDIHALFQMTPYYYRSPKEKVMELQKKEQLSTRLHFVVDVYQKQ